MSLAQKILTLGAFLLIPLINPAVAEEPLDLAPNEIRAALGLFNRHAGHKVPLLSGKQIGELLAGDVVKIRQKPGTVDEPQTAVGYILIDESRESVWLAATDPHFQPIEKFIEHEISSDGTGNSTWYQHFDLPWPVADRHWIIDLKNREEMHLKTKGRIWELEWDLKEGGEPQAMKLVRESKVQGITVETARASIYVPVNRGAWIAITLRGERTLIVYHATTVVGGMVPDSLVVRFAMSALDELLYGVAERAAKMKIHYGANHKPWPGGDGLPLQFK